MLTFLLVLQNLLLFFCYPSNVTHFCEYHFLILFFFSSSPYFSSCFLIRLHQQSLFPLLRFTFFSHFPCFLFSLSLSVSSYLRLSFYLSLSVNLSIVELLSKILRIYILLPTFSSVFHFPDIYPLICFKVKPNLTSLCNHSE